jgi:hypothetical protein
MQLCAVNPRTRGVRGPAPRPGWVEHDGLWVVDVRSEEVEKGEWRRWCVTWAECEPMGSSSVLRAVLERSPRFGTSAATLLGIGRSELGQWTRLDQSALVTVSSVLVAAQDEMEALGVGSDPTVFAPVRRALARGVRTGECWVGPCP